MIKLEINVEQIKKNVQILAQKIGYDQKAIDKAYRLFEKELTARGVSPENLEQHTWIRVQSSLKRKGLGVDNQREEPGFYMARGRAYDASKKPRESAQKYIEEHGLQSAFSAAYAIKNNNPKEPQEYDLLYKDYEWRMGKVIPKEDWQANGIAVMKIMGTVKFCNARFKGKAATEPIELFKLAPIPHYMREERQDACDVTFSRLADSYESDYVNLKDYATYIQKAHPDKILPNLLSIEAFYDKDPNGFNRWCIVEGNVIRIAPIEKTNSVAVEIEDLSLTFDEDLNNIPHMTIFFSDSIPIDFKDGAIGVTFVVNPYRNKNNEITLSGMGYWVEPMYRGSIVLDEDPDIEDPWG